MEACPESILLNRYGRTDLFIPGRLHERRDCCMLDLVIGGKYGKKDPQENSLCELAGRDGTYHP
jgi:hypothetical protein